MLLRRRPDDMQGATRAARVAWRAWLGGLAAALALAACGGGSDAPAAAYFDPVLYSSAADASLPDATELASVTSHQLQLGGTTLDYTATAGHLTARDARSGAAEASFFYVAYTLDGRSAATRPVTFFYNGGPGSASVWLHLGSFGPKRLATGAPSTSTPTPFALVDNAQSLLDVSDLVFVDAVGSGLSQAIAPYRNQNFWGVDRDAAVFRDFVQRYVAANQRAASPKFLFGESYGTTRSAVLANLLESAGVELKGVVLQSSVLDYNSNCAAVVRAAVSCAGFLPSYGATGAWFNLDRPNPADLPPFIAAMRSLSTDSYDPAVRSHLSAGTAPAPALLAQLENTTGLAQAVWQARFNLDPDTYRRQLVAGTLIGRYDARVNAPQGSALASEGDPSSAFISPSFGAAITRYLATQLQYTNPSSYVMLSRALEGWDFSHDSRPLPDTIPDLAAAMVQNPKLKVLSLNGYHDLATPFFQTELDLRRLGPATNVQVRSYLGGHMTYLDDGSRLLERADLLAFYQAALALP